MAITSGLYFVLAALCLLALIRRKAKHHAVAQGLNYPPGPRGLPLVGNLLDIPIQRQWETFTKWEAQYGDICYVNALGNQILVLNSLPAINDLLVDRAHIYSDRPTFTMVGELMGLDNSIPLLPYGPTLKQHKKLCRIALSTEAVTKYFTIQEDAAAMFVFRSLQDPSTFMDQIRLTAGRIVLAATYGISVKTPDDVYITEAEETMLMIGKSTVPGAHFVDLFPMLKYLPSWIPFNRIHSTAQWGRDLLFSMVDRPFQHAKSEYEGGIARPSFVTDCFTKFEQDESNLSKAEQDHIIRWAAGAMYGAGGESTYSTILSFILAMALFPSVQSKLHAELDSVIGSSRLPSIKDRELLPYLNATIKEALRWRPALPLGIPRRNNRADHYRGYYIPEGTIVIPNIWAISQRETGDGDHPASHFAPERFLGNVPSTPDPATYAFGFGRRVCPGKYMGDNNLFCLISMLMACVKIAPKVDKDGRELQPNPEYTSGLVSFPEEYKVQFEPRANATQLLEARLVCIS